MGNGNGDGLVWTYSGAITAFDLPPIYQQTPFRIPVVRFNGTSEEADTLDAAFWSLLSGGVDAAFTLGAWLNVLNTAASRVILSKRDVQSALREWSFLVVGTDVLRLNLFDESTDAGILRDSDTAITQGVLRFLVATYDGRGGSDAGDGITLYDNGRVLASTATNDGSYVDMEDLTVLPALGFNIGGSGPANFYESIMLGGVLGPAVAQRQLTDAQVFNWYHTGLQCQKASFPLGRRRGR